MEIDDEISTFLFKRYYKEMARSKL